MSDIVLSASVRQNLLSLQSTAELLATTQNRLSTGKKVNTALDNPTNYFTAAGLDNRASDISNLLDSIGNGVQVLQAANTGLTSLQKLVDTAKSIANQVLQATRRLFGEGIRHHGGADWRRPAGRCRNCRRPDQCGYQLAQWRDLRLYARRRCGDHHHGQQHGCRRQRQLDRCFQCGAFFRRHWIDGVIGSQRVDRLHLHQRQCKPDPHRSARRQLRIPLRSAAPAHSRLSPPPAAPPANRSPMRLPRPFVPIWWPSTTTSSRRSRRRLRIRPSTASIC